MNKAYSQGKFEGLYKYIHSPVNITSEDVDPMKKRKSKRYDEGPVGVSVSQNADNGEIIYKQLGDGDYVIQPKFMLNSGSMCVTELYSKSLRVRLVHEILFKDKMAKPIPSLPLIYKRERSETNESKCIEAIASNPDSSLRQNGVIKNINGLLKLRRPSEELSKALVMKKLAQHCKKKVWKNKILIPYEKKYMCGLDNKETHGMTIKNVSPLMKSLKNPSYLRAQKHLRALSEMKSGNKKLKLSRNRLFERFKRTIKMGEVAKTNTTQITPAA